MIEVVNTPATIEATTEATMTLTTPQPSDLLQSLMKLLDEHIEKKVAERVAVLEERLNSITTVTDERIVEIAEAAAYQVMEDHTTNYDHDDYDNMVNNIDDRINDAIYDYDLDDKINEAISVYDFDDKINDAINNYDMEDKIKDTIRDLTFNIRVE